MAEREHVTKVANQMNIYSDVEVVIFAKELARIGGFKSDDVWVDAYNALTAAGVH